jgi:hypothetical protein
MTERPWPGICFHGVMSWDALHHNTVANTIAALAVARDSLVEGGLLLATLKSTRADLFGVGVEVEPGTFVRDSGWEAGVPHHYFDETGVREALEGWEILSLVEQVCDYAVRCDDFLRVNPFPHTRWGILARRMP